MHVELNNNGGLQSLLNQKSLANTGAMQHSNSQSAIKVIDPLAAAEERLIKQLGDFPNDPVAQEALRERLGNLNINAAFSAGRGKSEDGTTWVDLGGSESKNGKTITTKEPHRVFVDNLTRRVNDGLAKGESVEDLSQLLDEASQGALNAHGEVRNILDSLGKLDKNSSDYINSSESFVRFGLERESAKINGEEDIASFFDNSKDFTNINKNDKSLQFSIMTNEGDEINITLNFNSKRNAEDLTYGKSVSLSYTIDGDINAKEHQAFTELLGAVAETSDALLNGAEFTDLIGVEVFDASQLQGFDLKLSSSDDNGAKPKNNYDFSYSHDDDDQYVSFTHNMVTNSGFNVAVSNMSLSSKIGGTYDESKIESMLNIIGDADKVAHKNDRFQSQSPENNPSNTSLLTNAVQTLFKTAERLGKSIGHANEHLDDSVALAKDMFNQLSETDPRYQGIDADEKDRIKEGFSTLADHHISYQQVTGKFNPSDSTSTNIGVGKNNENTNGYQVDFKQNTKTKDIEGVDEQKGNNIKQTSSYSVEAEKKAGVIAKGNNVKDYWKVDESYAVNLLSIDGGVVGLDQERERNERRDSFEYVGSGQYVRRESVDDTEASSKIRILDNFWAERNSYEKEGFEKFSLYNGRREEDKDEDQSFEKKYNEQDSKLTLIGDLKKTDQNGEQRPLVIQGEGGKQLVMIDELEKLLDNSDYRHKRIVDIIHGIDKIDQVMNGSINKLDFKI
jgi:hypothetical protein